MWKTTSMSRLLGSTSHPVQNFLRKHHVRKQNYFTSPDHDPFLFFYCRSKKSVHFSYTYNFQWRCKEIRWAYMCLQERPCGLHNVLAKLSSLKSSDTLTTLSLLKNCRAQQHYINGPYLTRVLYTVSQVLGKRRGIVSFLSVSKGQINVSFKPRRSCFTCLEVLSRTFII